MVSHKVLHTGSNRVQRAFWLLLRNYLFMPPMTGNSGAHPLPRPRSALQHADDGTYSAEDRQADAVLEDTVDPDILAKVLPALLKEPEPLAYALHDCIAADRFDTSVRFQCCALIA